MRVNMKVSDAMNEERKRLKATWREVITQGIKTLKGNPTPKINSKAIEGHLKRALQGITNAWELIQKLETTDPPK